MSACVSPPLKQRAAFLPRLTRRLYQTRAGRARPRSRGARGALSRLHPGTHHSSFKFGLCLIGLRKLQRPGPSTGTRSPCGSPRFRAIVWEKRPTPAGVLINTPLQRQHPTTPSGRKRRPILSTPPSKQSNPLPRPTRQRNMSAAVDRGAGAPVLNLKTHMPEDRMTPVSTTTGSASRTGTPAPASARLSSASTERSFGTLGRHGRFSTSGDRSAARLGDSQARRVFLPVAPSFVRKLHVMDDASSVDSGDDRRYSDVPSMSTLPRPSAAPSIAEDPTPSPRSVSGASGASFAVSSATLRPKPVHPVADPPKARGVWRRLFGGREPKAPKNATKAPPAKQTAKPTRRRAPRADDIEAMDPSLGVSHVEDDLPDARPATPPRTRLDPLRWATLACLPKNRGARARRSTREHADRREEHDHSTGSSLSRLPKGQRPTPPVDPLNEPNSFAGFRTRPWYLFPEGSSVSSGDWDGTETPGAGSARSVPRAARQEKGSQRRSARG